MRNDNINNLNSGLNSDYSSDTNHSFGATLKEVGTSVKDLVQSEVNLIKAEIKESSEGLSRHLVQAAIFGSLVAISVLPFVAFLVIGLGRILNDNYWLSSLIITVLFAGIGGPMAFRAFKKIKDEDVQLPRTKRSLENTKEVVEDRVTDIKDATRRRSA